MRDRRRLRTIILEVKSEMIMSKIVEDHFEIGNIPNMDIKLVLVENCQVVIESSNIIKAYKYSAKNNFIVHLT